MEGSALCIDGPATPTDDTPVSIAAVTVQDSVFVGNGLLDTTTANSSSAAIHQQGALLLANCSFQGNTASGLWVGSAAVSTTVAYCAFDGGANHSNYRDFAARP